MMQRVAEKNIYISIQKMVIFQTIFFYINTADINLAVIVICMVGKLQK